MRLAATIALAFGLAMSLAGQDPHFSQFHYSPQTLNPAEIGDFDATYRINANQKTQWRQVSKPYTTFALMGDGTPDFLPEGFAGGLLVMNDHAGDSKFNTFSVLPGLSYGLTPFEDKRQNVRAGIQMGATQIKLDEMDLSFDNQYNGVVYDSGLPTGENLDRNSRWYFNLNVGVQYRWDKAPRKTVSFGMAGHNVSAPEQSFYNDTGIKLPFRYSVHATAIWKVSEDLDAMPVVRYMHQGTYSETIFGSALRYVMLDERQLYRSVFVGYFGRFGDSGIAMAGVELDEWRLAASYDINVSDLKTASRNRGGFELSLQYLIGRKAGTTGFRHRYCPDFL